MNRIRISFHLRKTPISQNHRKNKFNHNYGLTDWINNSICEILQSARCDICVIM